MIAIGHAGPLMGTFLVGTILVCRPATPRPAGEALTTVGLIARSLPS